MAANQLASVFVKIGAEVGDFEKGLKSVKNDMNALEKTSDTLGKALKASFAIGVAAVAGFAAAVGASVKAAADMEQQVADIRSIFGKTAPTVEELNDLILDLGLDPKLKVSATEAAQAIEMLGKNGLTMSEITAGAAKNTVLLANATGDNFALAADIATDVMMQFNVSADNMATAVDGIVGVTQASKFSIDDYALAIAQAGGVASSVGVSLDDFNAVIAATSSSFASGSDAGTSFKTFLQRLVPQTDKAAGVMGDLGIITEAAGNRFFDANGQMKSMEEIAGVLQDAFGGLSEAQKIEAAATVFGTDAMRTAFALANGGTAVIQQMKTAIGDTSAEEAAAMRMDTFAGQLEIAMGIIESLSISIGQKFLPVLRPLIERFNDLAQKYGPKVVDFFGVIADHMARWTEEALAVSEGTSELWVKIQTGLPILQGYLQGVQELLKPVTDAIGRFVGWKDVLTALGLLMGGLLLSAIASLVAAMAPVIATIAAVTAAVAALRWAWQNDFMGIQTFMRRWFDKIGDWFVNESGLWLGSWEKTLDNIGWVVQYGWENYIFFPIRSWLIQTRNDIILFAKTAIKTFEQWFSDAKHKFSTGISVLASYVIQWRDGIISDVRHWASVTQDKIETWVGVIETKFKVWKNNTVAKVTEWRDDLIERFKDAFEWWKPDEWLTKGREIIAGLRKGIEEKWDALSTWFEGVWGKLTDKFKRFFGIASPSKLFRSYGEYLMQGLELGIKDEAKTVENAVDGVAAALDSKMNATRMAVHEQMNAIVKAINGPATGTVLTPPSGGGSNGGPVTGAPVNNKYYKSLGSSLEALFGDIGVNVASKINTFAYLAKQAITAPGQAQWQGSSASYMGYNVIDEANVSEAGTGAVIGAIQALINELRNRSIKIDTAQMEALIDALKSGNPNAYSDLVGFMAGGR